MQWKNLLILPLGFFLEVQKRYKEKTASMKQFSHSVRNFTLTLNSNAEHRMCPVLFSHDYKSIMTSILIDGCFVHPLFNQSGKHRVINWPSVNNRDIHFIVSKCTFHLTEIFFEDVGICAKK